MLNHDPVGPTQAFHSSTMGMGWGQWDESPLGKGHEARRAWRGDPADPLFTGCTEEVHVVMWWCQRRKGGGGWGVSGEAWYPLEGSMNMGCEESYFATSGTASR